MGGIRHKNLAADSVLELYTKSGIHVWEPPVDEELFLRYFAFDSTAADQDLSLSIHMTNLRDLPVPIRPRLVLMNSQANTLAPHMVQVNPAFDSTDSFDIVLTGRLFGRDKSERLQVTPASLTGSGTQRRAVPFKTFFDDITAIRLENVVGTFGTTTELTIALGTTMGHKGSASLQRAFTYYPYYQSATFLSRSALYYDDGTAATVAQSTNQATVRIDNSGTLLSIPVRQAKFDRYIGRFVVDTTADTLTLAGTTLSQGDLVQVRAGSAAALPAPLVAGTTYFVENSGVGEIQLLEEEYGTAGIGTPIDLTTGNGEGVDVFACVNAWRRVFLRYENPDALDLGL